MPGGAAAGGGGLRPDRAGRARRAGPEPAADAYETAGTRTAWYELRLPAGPPRGIVLAFHGGGWQAVGPSLVREMASYREGELVRKWRAKGFITVFSTYAANEPSWTDVVSVYDQLHARYPDLPIGTYGQSAGGHLALLLGAARPLAFAVSDAGPTNWATWKSTYPCFTRNCVPVPGTFENSVGIGAWYVDTHLPRVFGASTDPHPNLEDYDVVPNYDATRGPDPFLIYGRRAVPVDPFTQIGDGSPADGRGGVAYIDSDDDLATTADWYEADFLIPQQQGTILAQRVGPRAVLRTLPKGTVLGVHAFYDGAVAAAVYDEMIQWTAARADATPAAPGAKPNLGLGPLPDRPAGTYSVRGCNGAPGRSGVSSTGAWVPSLPDSGVLDASESGCSTALSAQTAVEGMRVRANPVASGPIAQGAAAATTFSAPPGTTIAGYGASYRGHRVLRGWEMTLVARDAAGTAATLAACPAGGPCAPHADELVPPGTTSAGSGPYPPQAFAVPAGTTSLTWRLACLQPGGCAADRLAFVNVFASAVDIADPADPTAVLTGDFADGQPHRGALAGTIEAADAAAGVRRIEVAFAGETQTVRPRCDYSRPRPCPAVHSLALARDTGSLADGPQPIAVRVVDGSGRSTTITGSVIVGAPVPGPPPPLAPASVPARLVPPPPKPANPFATGRGLAQLTSCATGPVTTSYVLRGRRLRVDAVAASGLTGATATLHAGSRRVDAAAVAADGRVRFAATLRAHEVRGTFTVRAGGRASARLAVRARVTIAARRGGSRVALSGRVGRGTGRRVQLQRLVACGRWRTLRTVTAGSDGSYRATVPAGTARGGAYRAEVGAAAVLGRRLGPRLSSRVAVT